jgi:hypothetical protein
MATHEDVRAPVNAFHKVRMDVHIIEGKDAIYLIKPAMTM